jgi:small subunit ribosomal protein S9
MMADEENRETTDEQVPSAPDEQGDAGAEAQATSASGEQDEPTAEGQTTSTVGEQGEATAEEPAAAMPEHAVPTEEATEIAAVAEDAPLEALQEAEEAKAEEPVAQEGSSVQEEPPAQEEPVAEESAEEAAATAESPAGESSAAESPAGEGPAAESPAGESSAAESSAGEGPAGEQGDTDDEEEEPAPRVKPSVPGAHLEVDIVPEGADPLGRDQGYVDPYAVEDEAEEDGEGEKEDREEEVLSEPIATAAIDLASGARYRATGKRKTAIARVTLRPGSGSYLVNGRALEEHFPRVTLQRNIRQPLETVGYQERMDVVARLHGGGISAQAGALRHGVSRALLEADPNLRGELKRRGFLTRDSRAKERKKAGLKKARKRPQFSKR